MEKHQKKLQILNLHEKMVQKMDSKFVDSVGPKEVPYPVPSFVVGLFHCRVNCVLNCHGNKAVVVGRRGREYVRCHAELRMRDYDRRENDDGIMTGHV